MDYEKYGDYTLYTVEVPGEPVPKGRPRFSKQGGFVRTYTPQETIHFENLVGFYFKNRYKSHMATLKPCALEINIYLKIPVSMTKRKKELVISHGQYPCLKQKDVDNFGKSVMDGLNDIAYRDDKQVFSLQVNKFYGYHPRTEIGLFIFNELELI